MGDVGHNPFSTAPSQCGRARQHGWTMVSHREAIIEDSNSGRRHFALLELSDKLRARQNSS